MDSVEINFAGIIDETEKRKEKAQGYIVKRFENGVYEVFATKKHNVYYITENNGVFVCNCPDSIYRPQYECKHVQAVKLKGDSDGVST